MHPSWQSGRTSESLAAGDSGFQGLPNTTCALPAQSKLQTYMNARSSPDVTTSMGSLSITNGGGPTTSSNSVPDPTAAEFVPASKSQLHADGPPFTVGGLKGDMGFMSTSPSTSPHLGRRNRRYAAGDYVPNTGPSPIYHQEVQGCTTYFYNVNDSVDPPPDPVNSTSRPAVLPPDFTMYPGQQPNVQLMKPKANAPAFFMSDELRLDILNRQALTLAQPNAELMADIPAEVDAYHHLCPLESAPGKSTAFGYVTSVYKATNIKTGLLYCLRRIHGFRLTNTKCMTFVELWKKLEHSNLVHLREVFTTKAFGDTSIVFVYDYHAGADTLHNVYFAQHQINGYSLAKSRGLTQTSGGGKGGSSSSYLRGGDSNTLRQHNGLLPESLIWAYVVQLSSALRTIHTAGLACRSLDATKILITAKSRLRLNCCGIADVLVYDATMPKASVMPHYQREDLTALGRIVLSLACNTQMASQHIEQSMDLVTRSYSSDLRNLLVCLLSPPQRPVSINDIMPMIGARFYTQLDAGQMRSDVIEADLGKEVENGRLFRLLVKLCAINERPEFQLDASWSETGDRYMLKLFRDYVFHQVNKEGQPWLDMAHIVQCLNKLDAGVSESICLMSRDEQNVLVVTYAELKHMLETSFQQLYRSSSTHSQMASHHGASHRR